MANLQKDHISLSSICDQFLDHSLKLQRNHMRECELVPLFFCHVFRIRHGAIQALTVQPVSRFTWNRLLPCTPHYRLQWVDIRQLRKLEKTLAIVRCSVLSTFDNGLFFYVHGAFVQGFLNLETLEVRSPIRKIDRAQFYKQSYWCKSVIPISYTETEITIAKDTHSSWTYYLSKAST